MFPEDKFSISHVADSLELIDSTKVFKINYKTSTLSLSTESNNDVGTYKFHVDYAMPKHSNTTLKVLNTRQFQIDILKRPLFAPYFEKPLDKIVTVTLDEEISYKLPAYAKYDRDDEKLDSVVITISDPSADKQLNSKILKYITFDNVLN